MKSSKEAKGTASRLLFPAETQESRATDETESGSNCADSPSSPVAPGREARKMSMMGTPKSIASPNPVVREQQSSSSLSKASARCSKENRQFNIASRPDHLESVLRTEEAKLLDLISRVSVKPAEFEDPFADLGGEEAFIKPSNKSPASYSSPMSRKEMRRSMIRASMAAPPLIGSDNIESSYNRTVIESMQAMVAQSVEDMKAMQAEKDKEIGRLNQKVKVLEDDIENLRDQLCIVAHYSNLFASSTRNAMNDGNFAITGTKKMFLEKLGDTLTTMLDKFGFIDGGTGLPSASSAISSSTEGGAPRSAQRRQSLNAIPFQRVMASRAYKEGFEEANENPFEDVHEEEEGGGGADSTFRARSQSIVPFSTPYDYSRPQPKNNDDSSCFPRFSDLISLPMEVDAVVEEIFVAFSGYQHTRDKKPVQRTNSPVELERIQMSKRNFLAMCLIIDIIDTKLTLQVAKACFEKHAFDCDQGKVKLSSRLSINSFTECLARMASFKYLSTNPVASQHRSVSAKQMASSSSEAKGTKNIERLLRSSAWETFKDHPLKQKLIDTFIDFCHPSVFDAFAKFQDLLYRAYQRSVNYCIESRVTAPLSSSSKTDPASPTASSTPQSTPTSASISERAQAPERRGSLTTSPSARYMSALSRGKHRIVPNFDRKTKSLTERTITDDEGTDFEASFLTSSASDADIKVCIGFKVFCAEYRIVPTLTRESVAVRIAMHMSMLSADGFRYFMGCMFCLCIALTKTEGMESDGDMFESVKYSANLLAVLDRLLLQVQAYI